MTIYGGCSHTACPPYGPCRYTNAWSTTRITTTAPAQPTIDPGPLGDLGVRQFGPCPKCHGGSDIRVVYHNGERHCKDCSHYSDCEHSAVCGYRNGFGGKKGEHLAVTCSRCHFAWLEKVGEKP